MVTIGVGGMTDGAPKSLYGLSSDTKPVNGSVIDGITIQIAQGSTFFEIDTGDVYIYDKSIDNWRLPAN